MRGVIFHGERMLELASFDDPAPAAGDVILEMKASGMCGSDLKYYREPAGEALAAFGISSVDGAASVIAGHEPCGVVAAVGEDVDPGVVRVGDRVMVHHYAGCGSCGQCRIAWPQMCARGPAVFGATAHGGHADYMKVPARTLVPLPEELSFSAGAAISCGTGTAFGALVRMDLTARDTVAIFGLGPVGQSAVQIAAAMGAEVIAVDVSGERVAKAEGFGAAHAIDASAVDAVEVIREITRGVGVPRALDCSGASSARKDAVRCAASWGTVVFVGEGGEVTLEVSPELIRKQLTVLGSYTFSEVGLANCAHFIARHGIDVDQVFTDRWRIEDAERAYREFDKQVGGKAVIEF